MWLLEFAGTPYLRHSFPPAAIWCKLLEVSPAVSLQHREDVPLASLAVYRVSGALGRKYVSTEAK